MGLLAKAPERMTLEARRADNEGLQVQSMGESNHWCGGTAVEISGPKRDSGGRPLIDETAPQRGEH